MNLKAWQVEDVVIRKPSMTPSISQILQEVEDAPKSAKVDVLRKHQSPALVKVLSVCYDPNVTWLLPEGSPPYKPSNLTEIEGRLYQEAKHLYLFIEGGNPNLTSLKRQNIFIQMLESVTPDDAKLLISIKDRKLPYKSITPKLVQEAFPGIF